MSGYFFPASHGLTSQYPAKNGHITVARTSSYGLMMTFHILIHIPVHQKRTSGLQESQLCTFNGLRRFRQKHVTSQNVTFCCSLSCKVVDLFAYLYSLKVSAMKQTNKPTNKQKTHTLQRCPRFFFLSFSIIRFEIHPDVYGNIIFVPDLFFRTYFTEIVWLICFSEYLIRSVSELTNLEKLVFRFSFCRIP